MIFPTILKTTAGNFLLLGHKYYLLIYAYKYIFFFLLCVGNVAVKRVPHIRRVARAVRVVRVQKSSGNQEQDFGRDSNGFQTGIVQIIRRVLCYIVVIIIIL